MNRSITVKGAGSVSVKPDLVIITMALETKHLEYDKTMERAVQSHEDLRLAVQSTGFSKEDLKTTSFNIRTEYENYHDQDNKYRTRFVGYVVTQDLKLTFDFNNSLLAKVVEAIAKAPVTPQLDIRFSVRDQDQVKADILRKATENAKTKAEILTSSAGVALGDLLSIDYSWVDGVIISRSNVMVERKAMAGAAYSMDVEPENIEAGDTVTFIWEIT